jgi:hypothetical protein
VDHASSNWLRPPDPRLFGPAAYVTAVASVIFAAGVPRIWAPMPSYVVLLGWIVGPAAVLLPAILLFAWCWPISKDASVVPRRSIVLLVILASLSVVYFTTSRRYGVRYQGPAHTLAVACINMLMLAALAFLAFHIAHRPNRAGPVIFHTLLFVWLGWSAFPYLGELP